MFSVMERHLIGFLGGVAGFAQADGLFCPGGSMANCFAMLLARQRMFPTVKEEGVSALPQLAAFVSDQAHYSFAKAAIMLGHGTKSVIRVRSNANGQMVGRELESAIAEAKARHLVPFMVAATAGSTVLGAFDPLDDISSVCRRHGLWLHVDGALGGAWLFSRRHRHLLAGLELADSLTWDFHKMLSVPVYCSLLLLNRQPSILADAFSLNAQYLFQKDKYYEKKYDTGDRSAQCIRKVEAFKLLLYLKAHGLRRLESIVDNAFDMCRYFEQCVAQRANFRLLMSASASTNVCFFFIPDRYLSDVKSISSAQYSRIAIELKRRMMTTGTMMVAYQPIPEKQIPACFRLNIAALPVLTPDNIDQLVASFEKLGKSIVVEDD